jgi:acetyl esterase
MASAKLLSSLPAAPSSGRTPVDPSTIALTAHSRALLAANAAAPPLISIPVPTQRAAREAAVAATLARRGLTPVREVFDVPAGDAGVALRVYEPLAPSAAAPAILFIHGGGWALGSVRTHDELCRQLCAFSGCSVVSVDYRLSPEAPYPLPLDDCAAGFAWAARRAGAAGVVLAGDSAGGNLAAALALRLRDEGAGEGGALAQVLIYPAVDAACTADSYARFSHGFALTREKMAWFWGLYAPDEAMRALPYVSPLRASTLAGLPPALVLLADADVLRDEGAAYAVALEAAGARAKVVVFEQVLHGFVADADNELAPEAVRAIVAWLREAGVVR